MTKRPSVVVEYYVLMEDGVFVGIYTDIEEARQVARKFGAAKIEHRRYGYTTGTCEEVA